MNRDRTLRSVDDRNRISLNGFAEHVYYEITRSGEDIILTPVVAVPAYLAGRLKELDGAGARAR